MSEHQKHAKALIASEAQEVAALADRIGPTFDQAVETILGCQGRVIVAGMGKSGIIGRKIVATFNSTGTSSSYLHPAEAMHGDLGIMRPEDVLLVVSKSGQLQEIDMLFSAARRLNLTVIALCGTMNSELATRADITLDCSVSQEACPNNLVPTSSSTAALVMGDALAIALLSARNFSAEDFANIHPGGFLGQRLLRRISDIHHTGDAIPLVAANATMSEMILQMTGKRLGCVITTTESGQVFGIFTDGDLRRLAEKHTDFYRFTASEVMIKHPKTIAADRVIDSALAMMEKHNIAQLPTVDEAGRLVGVIHLHDVLKAKIV